MADEEVSQETPSENPPAAPPVAAAPPADDAEKQQLRAQLQQTQGALGEVAEMVKSGKLKLSDALPGPVVEEDESALVDRKELKRHLEEMKRAVAGAVIETSSHSARMVQGNTMDLIAPRLKNFDKYKTEIQALLGKMDPRVGAQAETIEKVYKVVRAEHMEEEMAAERASWEAGRSEDAEEGDDVAPVSNRIPGAMAGSGRTPAASMGDASMRPATRGRESVKPLSRDERVAAQLFGITDAAEYRKYADRSWSPDLFGSKGRSKF